MSDIHVLSPEVVDQIAAGEVVERPAHLVKELVENSIDAKATRVHVEFFDGGRIVKVIDNGKGMSPEDLPKSLERFATSKISKTDDLWKLKTFGFRGEALASIASVSKITLTSRREGDEQAHQLVSEYGKKSEIDKVGGSQGTTILMENLFENTPARLKFLKSDAAENTAIKTTLKAMALSHFDVEFRIQENGKLVNFWPACKSRKDRVEQILEIKPMYEGEAVRENVKAYAVFADPHNVAKTARNIWMFAQNRWIQDRSLQAAVNEAYRSLLMHGEYPIAAVWVEVDPDCVDVNIHPTKSQVKFQNPSLAFRAVAGALRSTLEQAPWIPKTAGAAANSGVNSHLSAEFQANDFNSNFKSTEGLPNFAKQMPAMPKENLSFEDASLSVTQFQKKDFSFPTTVNQPKIDYQTLAQAAESRQDFAGPQTSNSSEVPEARGYWSSLEVLGQANLTYIVTQNREKIVFVDQHAAHERVAFERLMSAWKGGKIDIQDFLFPLAIDMSPEKVEAILTLSKEIERLGVFIEALGPGTVGVKSAPLFIKDTILGNVLDRMAGEVVEQGGSYSLERAVGDICATMACHSVVRAGQALSVDQMKNLLREMDQFPLSSFCPHGRPVSVEYPFYKLEKDFGRIV
ncbi:DNA mismatch repair endonuclease MutL [Bdellovibrio svalbardensis]|uniref:DNA mismatch repair protein MutL n=1 Tax=Bdellovibrio svalbardensis TaxID=2972972 RepID=A0ABT6DLS5_9BACT|nr:DNA mismatch repair endonuclease MutL [Bdellovibrio svalbardensis]MDG0817457.1 DNA mismatch repair endonuclease MutL [Bdellovibrio svalbardensis]